MLCFPRSLCLAIEMMMMMANGYGKREDKPVENMSDFIRCRPYFRELFVLVPLFGRLFFGCSSCFTQSTFGKMGYGKVGEFCYVYPASDKLLPIPCLVCR